MKTKIFSIVLLVLLATTSVCSCDVNLDPDFGPEIWIDDIQYREEEEGIYNILWIQDKNREDNVIYVPDMIGDKIVNRIGGWSEKFIDRSYSFAADISHTEIVYFPWSIERVCYDSTWFSSEGECPLKYIISATTANEVDRGHPDYWQSVAPRVAYLRGYSDLPANIAYFFNYEENPNNGYFFVDLLEESGKLTKPPYDPRREGYTFAGWYKDAECTEQWDFENDEVIITFDEEQNRIYEEICLYAKWIAE